MNWVGQSVPAEYSCNALLGFTSEKIAKKENHELQVLNRSKFSKHPNSLRITTVTPELSRIPIAWSQRPLDWKAMNPDRLIDKSRPKPT